MTHPKGTVPRLISENNALKYKVAQLEKELATRDLELGSTRNLLGAVIVAAVCHEITDGGVFISDESTTKSYQLDSKRVEKANGWVFIADVVEATFDVVPSELSSGHAVSDTHSDN